MQIQRQLFSRSNVLRRKRSLQKGHNQRHSAVKTRSKDKGIASDDQERIPDIHCKRSSLFRFIANLEVHHWNTDNTVHSEHPSTPNTEQAHSHPTQQQSLQVYWDTKSRSTGNKDLLVRYATYVPERRSPCGKLCLYIKICNCYTGWHFPFRLMPTSMSPKLDSINSLLFGKIQARLSWGINTPSGSPPLLQQVYCVLHFWNTKKISVPCSLCQWFECLQQWRWHQFAP